MKSFGTKPWLLPQPVLIIGIYDKDGNPNAMNAAWAGTWDRDRIMISLGAHQTTKNLEEKGDFTVAFATKETLTASDFVGIVSMKNNPDKIKKTGWTVVPAEQVKAPVFTEFPMTMECRVKEKLDESATGCYLIAEVVNILCDEAYLAEDGKPDMTRMNLISFDPIHLRYVQMGDVVGKAFSDGKALK
ncbi:flavin reductase [Prevotella sp. A2931]|uniref:Flavin reductase n=1 Tax=Prevotella illustrans TaxID=2800387 RepID=A0ABS3M4B8_9BACT|nr:MULTISPECIES: flavin reductase [Prevotella]MBO1362965.1 flavin reductase [Prevotella illustrans]PTL27132.1 flavin oxidoreductase [Prevotella sp. oral taxon 820]